LICSAPVSCSLLAGDDLLHEGRGLLYIGHDLVDDRLGAFGRADGALGQFGNFTGGHLAALGQLADLGGDHGEALARLARPRSLDGRVEREEVRLPRYLLDDAYLRGYLLDRIDRLPDYRSAASPPSRRPCGPWIRSRRAFSAFCLMFEAISSIELETSSMEVACSVAPWLRAWED
jgi:hypothetical protein